jgi:hypothetical protein
VKRVRIKDVRKFLISPGIRIRAGPYNIYLPLRDGRAVEYSKRWIMRQPWGKELMYLMSHAGITMDELESFLVGKYITVYEVKKVAEVDGPYMGTIQYRVN